MPRRARRRAEGSGPLGRPAGVPAVEDGFVVRPSLGDKVYRCPGCDQEIALAVPHVVTWPEDDPAGRRHWHTPCWAARGRRGVKVHRSKNAPRYG